MSEEQIDIARYLRAKGKSFAEIAKLIGCGKEAVRWQLSRKQKESPDTDTSGEQGHDKPRGDESPARSDADDTSAPTDGEKVS